jgi:Uncharacterized protein conserved in bacteria (DUF2188)
MIDNKYLVLLHEGEWKIKHVGELSARYRTQADAILDAFAAARRAGEGGRGAQVLVQGPDLVFRRVLHATTDSQ